MKQLTGIALLVLITVLVPAAAQNEITVPLRFDGYYQLDEIAAALKALHAAYPELTALDEIGKSFVNYKERISSRISQAGKSFVVEHEPGRVIRLPYENHFIAAQFRFETFERNIQ